MFWINVCWEIVLKLQIISHNILIIYLSSLRKANNFSIYTNFYHCDSEYQKFTKLSKTKPPHNSPKFARKSSQKTSEKKLSYFERISNINGIRHVISIILHRKNVNFVTCVVTYFCKQKISSPETGSVLCFCLLQSDQLQWWLYLIFVFFLVYYFLYFSVLFMWIQLCIENKLIYVILIPVFLHCVC